MSKHKVTAENETFGVKYIGSKRTIVGKIGDFVNDLGDVKTAIDVFSGTTRVAQYLRKKGITMTTSDLSWATTCYADTYVHNEKNEHLYEFVSKMNQLESVKGWLSENYTGDMPQDAPTAFGRCFQLRNAMKADAARDWIETLDLKPWEKHTLITSIIHGLDAVDNTVGVQQAYLKTWCARSKNHIEFKLPYSMSGPIGNHIEGDALKIDYEPNDLAYLDPPYSSHSYATYYHIWDSIAKWDKPETDLKSRRRVDRVTSHAKFEDTMTSPWNSASKVEEAFNTLIERLPVKYVLISYNDESLIPQSKLQEICDKHDKNHAAKPHEIEYKRNIMSQTGNAAKDGKNVEKNQTNKELLILIQK